MSAEADRRRLGIGGTQCWREAVVSSKVKVFNNGELGHIVRCILCHLTILT